MATHPAVDACQANILSKIKSIGGVSKQREEIDDFCQDELQLNLFLLALVAVQDNSDLTDIWSNFRIAAVHGNPPMEYNGCTAETLYQFLTDTNVKDEIPPVSATDSSKPTAGLRNTGFCTHGSVLFPSWHRGYLLTIEQAVQAKMWNIALKFTDPLLQETYKTKADRYPYWDMFRPRKYDTVNNVGQIGLSWIFCVQKVRVKKPETPNTWTEIDNPLYQYNYPSTAAIASAFPTVKTVNYSSIIKGVFHSCRNSSTSINKGSSDNVGVQRTLLNKSDPLDTNTNRYDPAAAYNWETFLNAGMRAKLYACLTQSLNPDLATASQYGQSYGRFATRYFEAARSRDAVSGVQEPRSLEGLHDTMHAAIATSGPGFYGTMGSTFYGCKLSRKHRTKDVKADLIDQSYDPIFHSFHAGFDLYYSLFLAAHPKLRWKKSDKLFGGANSTYNVQSHTQDTPVTPLTPFRVPPTSVSPAGLSGYFSRKVLKEYLNTEDVLRDKDWGYFYDVMGETINEADANTLINKLYSWLNPTTGHLSDMQVLNATAQNVVQNRVKPMNGVNAFLREGATEEARRITEKIQWPPLIDDRTEAVELHPPPPAAPVRVNPLVAPTTFTVSKSLSKASSSSTPALKSRKRSSVSKGGLVQLPILPASQQRNVKVEPTVPATAFADKAPVFAYDAPHPEQLYYNLPNHIVKDHREMKNWSFQMRYERFALNCGFDVYVFVGDFPADSTKWTSCDTLVLRANNFADPTHDLMNHDYSGPGDNPNRTPRPTNGPQANGTSCGNCAQQAAAGTLMADWVPLTPVLLGYVLSGRKASFDVPEAEAVLHSLEQEDVIPFLKRHLHWRIMRSDGVEIHRSDVSQFAAWVHDEVMLLPRTWDELPQYRDHAIQWEITHGRPGGLDDGEWP